MMTIEPAKDLVEHAQGAHGTATRPQYGREAARSPICEPQRQQSRSPEATAALRLGGPGPSPWAMDSFHRLDSIVLRETASEVWNETVLAEALGVVKRLREVRDRRSDEYVKALVSAYRLAYHAVVWRVPKEHFLRRLCGRLFMEAHVGPDALVNQPEYLGPLWDRLGAIWQSHGWPEEDQDGDVWCPEDHLDAMPKDYAAWKREFDEQADAMDAAAFRAVCLKYGVPEIADLRENDPEEFERRMEAGLRHAEAMPAKGDG